MERIQDIAQLILEKRQQKDYAGILAMSCRLVRSRAQLLKDNSQIVQWQQDNCEQMINKMDDISEKPVYYKRLDPNTLQAIIEFASTPSRHFIIVLLWEDTCFKYYNTKEIDEIEWQEISSTKNTNASDRAPDDYWGVWSSDEELQEPSRVTLDCHKYETDSEDDDYYTRWSQDPGTLTPGLEEETGRIMVDPPPKDPVDELTDMLKKSLPNPRMSMTPTPVSQLVQDFRTLIGTAKVLGLENTEIINMVQDILG